MIWGRSRGPRCTIALSEEVRDGARLGDILVRNPFTDEALAEDLRPLLGL